MKSIVEVEIERPRAEVAGLFADPSNSRKWMRDLARYEPVSGDPGMPGSTYRLVPREGGMMFVATVIERNLPDRVRVKLEASTVDVAIKGTFVALSPTRTRLISEELFSFKGSNNAVLDSVRQEAIRAAHRRNISDFKRFAEQN